MAARPPERSKPKRRLTPFSGRLVGRAAVAWSAVALAVLLLEGTAMSQHPFTRRVKVAPFPEGLTWINTAGSLKLENLRGKK